ncbi:MAG: hypothetical protein KGM24_10635 [Elusimicrobia bacterium]|nr:hypothetical protein [Elusimicrobiota bacterium]
MTRRKPRPLARDPLAVLLVAANLVLGGILAWRWIRARARPGLPPGHPDVSVPPEIAAAIRAADRARPPLAEEPVRLSGVVRLSPGLKEPWPEHAYVFVIARGEGDGPPFAVRRYADARPPLSWSLGAENEMIPGAPVPARLRLSVRVDQDGDALTRQLGDLAGGPSAPVSPRATVDLVVDRPATLVPAGSSF